MTASKDITFDLLPKWTVTIAQPGDTVILTTHDTVTQDEADYIKARVEANGAHLVIIGQAEAHVTPAPIVINVTGTLVGDRDALAKTVTTAINDARNNGTIPPA